MRNERGSESSALKNAFRIIANNQNVLTPQESELLLREVTARAVERRITSLVGRSLKPKP